MSRSQDSSRFGRLAEEKATRRYGLDLDHHAVDGVRVDARDGRGRPWDVKAAMDNRKRGPARFRFWKDQHDVLEANDGGYVLVLYRAVRNGIHVLDSKSVRAESLRLRWGGSGNHRRDSPQAKVLAADLLST